MNAICLNQYRHLFYLNSHYTNKEKRISEFLFHELQLLQLLLQTVSPPTDSSTKFHYNRITVWVRFPRNWCMRPHSKEIQTNPWHLPVISMCRRVSTIFSVTSSCIRVSLLFCRFSVSNEFKFSKTNGGNTLILKTRGKRRKRW